MMKLSLIKRLVTSRSFAMSLSIVVIGSSATAVFAQQAEEATKKPVAEKPVAEQPANEKPEIDKPVTDKPAEGELVAAVKLENVPEVFLSTQHKKLCKLVVGDVMPDLKLPDAQSPTDPPKPLSARFGDRATVVVFWQGEGHAVKALLRDLAPDVIERFGKRGVGVVAIAVETAIGKAQKLTTQLAYPGPTLLDRSGEGFAQVASARTPRVYILDGNGKVVWFDIEYSLATRREMEQTLTALSPKPPAAKEKPAKKPAGS